MQDIARVINAMPGQLADVNQAVGAADIDEGAKVAQAGDDAVDDIADIQLGQQLGLARARHSFCASRSLKIRRRRS